MEGWRGTVLLVLLIAALAIVLYSLVREGWK